MKKTVIIVVLILAAASLIFLPYRAWLEKRLEIILENKGFANVQLTIASLGLKSASLENVTIGGENKLNLKNIILDYSPRDLWNGNIQDIALSGLTIDARQENGRWVITGLEGWNDKPESSVSESFAVPLTSGQLARIPFQRIKFEDSQLNLSFSKGKLSLPLELSWQKAPQSQFTYRGNDLSFNLNNFDVTADNLTLDANIEENQEKWAGRWTLRDLNVKGGSLPVPTMMGAGTALADGTHAEIEGLLDSEDKSWQLQFNMDYDFKASEKSTLNIVEAHMPWKNGRIAVRKIKVPLDGKNSIKINLELEHVSLQEIMQSLTGDRISATGNVSGTLPLIIAPDGKITVLQGNLKSEGPGKVSLPPDVIPGNNEQVALVREILEDLQYTQLSIQVKNDDSGHLGALLAFEGNNPKVYEGKPVKLNVNLTGDVLGFIQDNLMLLTDPEQLLRQGNDEKE